MCDPIFGVIRSNIVKLLFTAMLQIVNEGLLLLACGKTECGRPDDRAAFLEVLGTALWDTQERLAAVHSLSIDAHWAKCTSMAPLFAMVRDLAAELLRSGMPCVCSMDEFLERVARICPDLPSGYVFDYLHCSLAVRSLPGAMPLIVLDPLWLSFLSSTVCGWRRHQDLPMSFRKHGLVVDSDGFHDRLWSGVLKDVNRAGMAQLLHHMNVFTPVPGTSVSIVPHMFPELRELRKTVSETCDFWIGPCLGTHTEAGISVKLPVRNAVWTVFQAKCVALVVPQLCGRSCMLLSWAGQRALVTWDTEACTLSWRVRGSQPRLLRFVLLEVLRNVLFVHVPYADARAQVMSILCPVCDHGTQFIGILARKACKGKPFYCSFCTGAGAVLDVQDLVNPSEEWRTMAQRIIGGTAPPRPVVGAQASPMRFALIVANGCDPDIGDCFELVHRRVCASGVPSERICAMQDCSQETLWHGVDALSAATGTQAGCHVLVYRGYANLPPPLMPYFYR
jgi:hypothetical protein